MARRATKAEAYLIAFVIIVGMPIYLISKFLKTTGWVTPLIFIISVVILIYLYQNDKNKKRLVYLREKYNDEEIVQKIYNGYFWQGQTEGQLEDSLGKPLAVDRKVLKTKTTEVWKYNSKGANRYGLRIKMEDGCVVGWDKKS